MPDLYRQYGIISPNGESHWGSFIQRPLGTEQERSVLSVVLHQLAQELGFDEAVFVNNFRWTSRTFTVESDTFPIDDPAVLQQGALVPDTIQPEPIQASE
jgi:hypothetical protein